jgi:Beta-galactosidase/beta-glucuronidase
MLVSALETGTEMMANMNPVDATVPGCIYRDLIKADIIKDPYFGLNSLSCEWVSQRWWLYKTVFEVTAELAGRNLRLTLSGIDYKAHIALGGVKLGEHEGMFTPFTADITQIVKLGGQNELRVLLESAPDEMGQIGYTSRTFTQKSRFTYRWDFCARLVHLGLYDSAFIEDFGCCAIDEADIRPVERADGGYTVGCAFMLHGFDTGTATVRYTLSYCGALVVSKSARINVKPGKNRIRTALKVDDPKLWWPSGHGEQPLYNLEVEVTDDDGVSDRREYTVGLRRLEFGRCDGAPEDSLPYVVKVNGKRIFLKGINLAPLDQLYGGLTECDYARVLGWAKDANINFVRVNGVGLIEPECFYELCDRLGIMVWQDFIQSSSGIDNSPSTAPAFLRLLKSTAERAVKVKRNHVCLTVWCGGNELRQEYKTNDPPVSLTHKNIAMLGRLVEKLDPARLFLPSTASGPNEFLNIAQPGRNHDVHGPWKYSGVREHYRQYNASDALFHSEFGTEGMSEVASLREFLPEEELAAQPFSASRVWRNHGDWWCSFGRDSELFGGFERGELDEFVRCSQFIQAESLRYSYEANRRRMFACAGAMAWQLNEPWPNVSNTCLVDYYGKRKLAYYYVRDALEPVKPTLRYDSLEWEREGDFKAELYVINECEARSSTVVCKAYELDGRLLYERSIKCALPEDGVAPLGEIAFALSGTQTAFRVELYQDGVKTACDYLFFIKEGDRIERKKAVCEYWDSAMNMLSGIPDSN